MNVKFVFCVAVLLVGQAMSASLFDGDELKRIAEQFSQSASSISQHFKEFIGVTPNSDAQKTIERYRAYFIKGISDIENESVKLGELMQKYSDPKLVEKFNQYEKDMKKFALDAKQYFDDKVGKPINDKYKDDIKKITEQFIKYTKEVEGSVNKLIDNTKKY
ncbi:uncharacterized protein LOC126902634 [Daktulosphaira vitifoliae]|uniref:uncharacterized protein LOC126902634 n=1 Tax=Daktulosphaira vitifoliae TaxID=58002 RepID=UPI0021AAE883|nr:uncharacterized protein LOC126902634 [Daktulosphaira vitifoliae]